MEDKNNSLFSVVFWDKVFYVLQIHFELWSLLNAEVTHMFYHI